MQISSSCSIRMAACGYGWPFLLLPLSEQIWRAKSLQDGKPGFVRKPDQIMSLILRDTIHTLFYLRSLR